MAEEEKKEAKKEESTPKPKKGFNFKIILIGLPLFIVQLVLVYFITATFLVKNTSGSHEGSKKEHVEESEEASEDEESDGESGAPQHIFSLNDLVINPAGTSGQRLLLLSVGLGVSDEEKAKMLEENEVLIKDVILNTVSKKSLRTLSKIEMKDSLKTEIAENVNKKFPKAKVKGVYFSKYVIN